MKFITVTYELDSDTDMTELKNAVKEKRFMDVCDIIDNQTITTVRAEVKETFDDWSKEKTEEFLKENQLK